MEKDGKLSSLLERLKDCNISHFKKDFIIAGPKTNVLAIYNALRKAGVHDPFYTRSKDYSKHKNIVALFTNDVKEIINSIFKSYLFERISFFFNISLYLSLWKTDTLFFFFHSPISFVIPNLRLIRANISSSISSICNLYSVKPLSVLIDGKNINDFTDLSIQEALDFIENLNLSEKEKIILKAFIEGLIK